MKKHAIIPIFIPHEGCPNDCVFCNQKAITARTAAPTLEEIRERIETHLQTLRGRGLETVEIAFYGGSFTGLSMEKQRGYLQVAWEYKEKGLVDKLHLSTRPDYINREILDQLKRYGVDVIELGVQSFDEEVLCKCNRGHSVQAVYESSALISRYGFEWGIQLMIGLPGDSYESCIRSAEETVALAPTLARLYPTVILKDTALYGMYERGEYVPPTEAEVLNRTKDMYRLLRDAGITILRVGLKSTDVIKEEGEALCGSYHPAFRQLVEGELLKEEMEMQISSLLRGKTGRAERIRCSTCGTDFSNMVGNNRRNAIYLEQAYPGTSFLFCRDDTVKEGGVRCEMEERNK